VVASRPARAERWIVEIRLELLMDSTHKDGVGRSGFDGVPDLAMVQNHDERWPPLAEDLIKSVECGIYVSTQ
jgi:hypothetical protein